MRIVALLLIMGMLISSFKLIQACWRAMFNAWREVIRVYQMQEEAMIKLEKTIKPKYEKK